GVRRMACEMLKRAANVDIAFIPYPGDAPAVNALLGGHVSAVFLPYSGVAAQLKAGQLRALASASGSRSESLPSVPTIAESGFKGFEADNWNGLFAPAKTPHDTVSALTGWIADAQAVPDVNAERIAQSLHPHP